MFYEICGETTLAEPRMGNRPTFETSHLYDCCKAYSDSKIVTQDKYYLHNSHGTNTYSNMI